MIGIYGVLIGALVGLAVASGQLGLNAHGAGIAVLAEAVRFIVVGVLMWSVARKR